MSDKANTSTDMNRRKALKTLAAAAGAAGIAALPTRWSKPTMRVGAVPAHAQASCGPLTITAGTSDVNSCNSFPSLVQIELSEFVENVPMQLTTQVSGDASFTSADPAGIYNSNAFGVVQSNNLTVSFGGAGGSIVFTWTFVNASDGCDTFTTTFFCAGIL